MLEDLRGAFGVMPNGIRPTHPPHQKPFPQKKKFIKGARNWRLDMGMQTLFWPPTHPTIPRGCGFCHLAMACCRHPKRVFRKFYLGRFTKVMVPLPPHPPSPVGGTVAGDGQEW